MTHPDREALIRARDALEGNDSHVSVSDGDGTALYKLDAQLYLNGIVENYETFRALLDAAISGQTGERHEPVAWRIKSSNNIWSFYDNEMDACSIALEYSLKAEALYTHPPRPDAAAVQGDTLEQLSNLLPEYWSLDNVGVRYPFFLVTLQYRGDDRPSCGYFMGGEGLTVKDAITAALSKLEGAE